MWLSMTPAQEMWAKDVFKIWRSQARQWWLMPLIPALGRQRQANVCDFETSLVYKS